MAFHACDTAKGPEMSTQGVQAEQGEQGALYNTSQGVDQGPKEGKGKGMSSARTQSADCEARAIAGQHSQGIASRKKGARPHQTAL